MWCRCAGRIECGKATAGQPTSYFRLTLRPFVSSRVQSEERKEDKEKEKTAVAPKDAKDAGDLGCRA